MYNICMDVNSDYINFEWDENKAYINEQKHNVTFESATEVFSDPHARVKADLKHSESEDRFHIMGMDLQTQVLLVCFCERNCGTSIRLISARHATNNEEKQYWSFRSKHGC